MINNEKSHSFSTLQHEQYPSWFFAESHYLTFSFFPKVHYASRIVHDELLSCANLNPRVTRPLFAFVLFCFSFLLLFVCFKERGLNYINGTSLWFILLASVVMSL